MAVAGSAFVAWTAVGYATNLALDVVAMAAAVMALEVLRGRRGIVAGALLLAGGALLHWMFTALFVGVLCALALVQIVLPGGAGARGSGRRAARRLGAMLVLAAVLAAAGLLIAPQHPARLPNVQPGMTGPLGRIAERLPAMALPVTLPLAVLGVVLLAFDRRDERGRAPALLLIWSSLAAVGLVGWYLLGLPLPPYRWAAFALAIPAAIVLGALLCEWNSLQ